MSRPTVDSDGFVVQDGEEIPYVLVTVACTRPGCPQYGVEHEIQAVFGWKGAVCYPCGQLAAKEGKAPKMHVVDEAVMARVRALPEPEVWKRRREEQERIQALLQATE